MTSISSPETAQTQPDSIYALARSADNANRLFAARTSGLYRSDDGATWQNVLASLNLGQDVSTTAVAVVGSAVFAGSVGAVLCSEDSGENWQIAALASPPPHVSAVAVSPSFAADGVVVAATMEDGVFVSTDRGQTWTPWNFGLVDLNVYAVCFSPDFGADRAIFAGTESGMFRSHNGGRSWREVPFPMDAAPVISLYATSGSILYAGTESNGLYTSRDGGQSWQQVGGLPTSTAVQAIHADAADGRQIWVLLADRLMYSGDSGQTWSQHGGNALFNKAALAMTADNAPATILVGFEDGEIVPFSR